MCFILCFTEISMVTTLALAVNTGTITPIILGLTQIGLVSFLTWCLNANIILFGKGKTLSETLN